MTLLLAEELVLLSLDDESGQCLLPQDVNAETAATALVYELTLRSTLKRSGKRLRRDSAVTVRDDLLAEAAEVADGLGVEDAIQSLASPSMLQAILNRLVAAGALTNADVWSPGPHWPPGARADAAVRRRMEDILVRDADPTQREAVLVSLLQERGLTARALPHADQTRLRERASAVAGSARPLRNRPATTTQESLVGQFFDLVTTPLRWRS